MTTTTEIQVTRNVQGMGLRGLTYEVDGALLATVTPSRRRMDSRSAIRRTWFVRLYNGPEDQDYDLYHVGDLTAAKAMAYDHASAF